MKPPEGYRELKIGEIINADDLAYSPYGDEFSKREKGHEYIGTIYNRAGQNETFRKIEVNNNKFSFFIPKGRKTWGTLAICVADKGGGHYFYSDGKYHVYDKYSNKEQLSKDCNIHDYQEISSKQLKQTFSLDFLSKVCSKLSISLEKMNVSDEEKNEIIQILKNSRAFNQDSAMAIDDGKRDICFQLAEDGAIKEENQRFYVE